MSSSDFVPAPVGGGEAGGATASKPKRKPRPSDLKRKAERAAAAKDKREAKVEKRMFVDLVKVGRPEQEKVKKPRAVRKVRRATGARRAAPKGIRAFIAPLRAQEKDLARQLKIVQSLMKRARKIAG